MKNPILVVEALSSPCNLSYKRFNSRVIRIIIKKKHYKFFFSQVKLSHDNRSCFVLSMTLLLRRTQNSALMERKMFQTPLTFNKPS